MDFDWPKISIFDIGNGDYSFSPPCKIQNKTLSFPLSNYSSFVSKEQLSIDYYFSVASSDKEVKGILNGKKKICLNGLCIRKMPPVDSLTFDRDDLLIVLTHKGYDWLNGNIFIDWSGVMSKIWNSREHMMENKNGEAISFEGLFGTCFGISPNKDV